MTNEPRALSRSDDPETARQAAASLSVPHLADLEQLIVDTLAASRHGLTCGEIAATIGYPRDSVSPRMRRLTEIKRVRYAGFARVPIGATRQQRVWEIVK